MTSSLPLLLDGPALDDALDDLALRATWAIDGVDAAGALVHRGTGVVARSSHPLAAAVDAVQHGSGQGPSLHALHTGEVVLLEVDDQDTRWPVFQSAARAAGARTVLSVPLRLADQNIGSLSLYSRAPRAFNARLVRQVEVFASPRVLGLTQWGFAADAAAVATVAGFELQDRVLVDRALGVLMGIHHDASVERARLRLQETADLLGVDVLGASRHVLAHVLRRED